MPGDSARLRDAGQRISDGFQARHIGPGPANSGERAKEQATPEAIGEKGKAQMRQRRGSGADQINPPGRHAVCQRKQHRHRGHIGREENANQPARLGGGKGPARHHLRQQGWQGEGADLGQDLRRDHGHNETPAAGGQGHGGIRPQITPLAKPGLIAGAPRPMLRSGD